MTAIQLHLMMMMKYFDEDPMNATNIPISTSKKTFSGRSGPLTGEQNESSLSNKNADNGNLF